MRLAGPDYNLRGRGVCPLRMRARSDSAIWPAQDLAGHRRAPGAGRTPGAGRGGAGAARSRVYTGPRGVRAVSPAASLGAPSCPPRGDCAVRGPASR